MAFTSDFLESGETIDLYRDDAQVNRPTIDLEIPIIYEDEYLAVVVKPAGIIVSGNKKWTLQNALSSNLKKSLEVDALPFPEPIHRLDYPTSGALLVGKTAGVTASLNRMFAERTIEKTYLAVAIGSMKQDGEICSDVDGKRSNTVYSVLKMLNSERFGFLNLLELTPETGRRHQLRKHLAEIGNPILGDRLYFNEGLILNGKGLYLHASSLLFSHPITGETIRATAPLPKKFLKLFPETVS